MSMMTYPWRPLSRNDRHVRRARLRLPDGVSEHRTTFLIEEALRLMALPGEEQGKTYYFRRVALRGLGAAATPREWVERAQSTMYALAVRAVHGADSRAAEADAVFFYSQEDALEWMLRRSLHVSSRGVSGASWFEPMICPAAVEADTGSQIAAMVDRLRSLPAGWFAAATVLMKAIEAEYGAVAALETIPEQTVRMWLAELGSVLPRGDKGLRPSQRRKGILNMLLAQYADAKSDAKSLAKSEDSGEAKAGSTLRVSQQQKLPQFLVWIASMVVVAEDPGEVARGSAVGNAMKMLEELREESFLTSRRERREERRSHETRSRIPNDAFSDGRPAMQVDGAQGGQGKDDGEAMLDEAGQQDFSLITIAGGLYFLLNVLRHLGMAMAIEALSPQDRKTFLPQVIRSLARAAAVPDTDPSMLWVTSAMDPDDHEMDRGSLISDAVCWPRTLLAAPETGVTVLRLVRIWTVAVRRWCWLNARLTLRDVVLREGRILLTRTDLDVTLTMDSVDLRLRRIGLDLDPGWLPWFGRVVRFHYVYAVPTGGAV